MYIQLYTQGMSKDVTITQLRNNLFQFADKAIAGESVEFVHKGVVLRITAVEQSASKLERLTPRQFVNPDLSDEEHRTAEQQLKDAMFREMERDWAEL
jgi:antitoxin (DNA-binding transcriptional repressor) of toxin-antitoxin stability system